MDWRVFLFVDAFEADVAQCVVYVALVVVGLDFLQAYYVGADVNYFA